MGSNKSHETLKRQWLLLNRMPHRGRKGTKYFQESLREMGLDVSLRTIQRDLKELSRQFPLVSDEERISGWKWSEDAAVFDIPGMDPHAALAFKMIDLHLGKMLPESCLNFLKPYGKRAGEVLSHLEDGGIAKWPKKIARISRHLTLEPPEIDRLVLSAIYDGLLLERQLEISYCNR
ncbi:MAG: transcriptional regulator, partial [Pseudomonadota bacterium]|nr:transcriptional regulator [Pseudomonadota bacterium]